MEQVKKEAMHFLSGGGAQRAVVDGVKIYSEKELEQEMGETLLAPTSNSFIHAYLCVCVCVYMYVTLNLKP